MLHSGLQTTKIPLGMHVGDQGHGGQTQSPQKRVLLPLQNLYHFLAFVTPHAL